MPDLPDWAKQLVDTARVGHLATASASAVPHVVVVCYVVVEDRVYVPIDDKPKSARTLARVRNIQENGQAMLVVDQYDEDWTRLAWVQARGPARLCSPGESEHGAAVTCLRDKYPQYRIMDLEVSALIEFRVATWRWWRFQDD